MFSTLAISYRVQFFVVSVHCWVQSVFSLLPWCYCCARVQCGCDDVVWCRVSICLSAHIDPLSLSCDSARRCPSPRSDVTRTPAASQHNTRTTRKAAVLRRNSSKDVCYDLFMKRQIHFQITVLKGVSTVFKWVAAMLKRRRISKTHILVVPQRPLTQFPIKSKPKRIVQIFYLEYGPL